MEAIIAALAGAVVGALIRVDSPRPYERVQGVGCTTAHVTADIVGRRVVRAQPDEEDSVGVDAEVLDVAVGNLRAESAST